MLPRFDIRPYPGTAYALDGWLASAVTGVWYLEAEERGSRFDLLHKTFGIEGVQDFAAREPTAAGYG